MNRRDNKTESEVMRNPFLWGLYTIPLRYRWRSNPDNVWTMYFRTESDRESYRSALYPFIQEIH